MIDLTNKTYQNLLQVLLSHVSNDYDKRDTSPIMTALGPAAYGLEDFYLALMQVQNAGSPLTAVGEDLDNWALIANISRNKATKAVRMGAFDTAVPIGSRFSTLNGEASINFSVTGAYTRTFSLLYFHSNTFKASSIYSGDGTYIITYTVSGWAYEGTVVSLASIGIAVSGNYAPGDYITVILSNDSDIALEAVNSNVYSYQMTAEEAGSIGNDYNGNIVPITYIPGLTAASIGQIFVQGADTETDDALRSRLIEALNSQPFAGNVAAYREHVLDIDGVGAVQVYPNGAVTVANPTGAGTVVLSILGEDFLPASSYLVNDVQEDVDPTDAQGEGVGYAPIGATVTVMTPTSVAINVSATLTLASGKTMGQVSPLVTAALTEYIKNLREQWDDNVSAGGVQYASNIYLSVVTSVIVSVDGVLNAADVKIGKGTGSLGTSDITLTESGTSQELPVLGQVTLSE